jgi:hypothetical protein
MVGAVSFQEDDTVVLYMEKTLQILLSQVMDFGLLI